MKVKFNNCKLEFYKYRLNIDVTIEGLLNETNKSGQYKAVRIEAGKKYLVTVPTESDFSLNNYESSYIWTINNGISNLYGATKNSIYLSRYLVDGYDGELILFAKTDEGTSVTFHVEEVNIDYDSERVEFSKEYDCVAGTGIYDFLKNELTEPRFYVFENSDNSIIDKFIDFNISKNEKAKYIITDRILISSSNEKITTKTQIGASNVIGTGKCRITIKSYALKS